MKRYAIGIHTLMEIGSIRIPYLCGTLFFMADEGNEVRTTAGILMNAIGMTAKSGIGRSTDKFKDILIALHNDNAITIIGDLTRKTSMATIQINMNHPLFGGGQRTRKLYFDQTEFKRITDTSYKRKDTVFAVLAAKKIAIIRHIEPTTAFEKITGKRIKLPRLNNIMQELGYKTD